MTRCKGEGEGVNKRGGNGRQDNINVKLKNNLEWLGIEDKQSCKGTLKLMHAYIGQKKNILFCELRGN